MDANAEEHAHTEEPWQALGTHGVLRGWLTPAAHNPALNHSPDDVIGVYVHGFRSDCSGSKSLALVRHAQQRRYSWLRFDLSGHGASAGRFGDFRLSQQLADLHTALAALPQREVVLVGSSMGAWLAVLATRMLPQRIVGLVLLAPGFNFLQRQFAAMSAAAQRQWQAEGKYRFSSHYDTSTYELDFAVVDDAHAYDVVSNPIELTCPVHIVHGESDEVVPIALSEQFFARLRAPRRQFTHIAGGNHRLTGADAAIATAVDSVWPAT